MDGYIKAAEFTDHTFGVIMQVAVKGALLKYTLWTKCGKMMKARVHYSNAFDPNAKKYKTEKQAMAAGK